ncbi:MULTISPECIES: DMT family transporter [Asticcacaulis]|uniref:DMT family transporter n=1 Tax=Asticcacaulis TaxID=76890 RepID=UPI001AE64148|nr:MULTISPECIES: DMT family transporter [Asticcacaulis]MBP2160363.1 drug/metabolite transporter (DMT)-like permease [Asticcacaulis solisilvae]MDR6801334.1 drug/metabolite transporter (DMT)-like permease [Asticcacaulis sp. BE141]
MRSGTSATTLGILCGMGAGALWGLVFLAPELVRAFHPLWLTIGRYLAYGAISAALIAPRWGALRAHLSRKEWLALLWLALAGNTLYYILLSAAVQMGGIAMTSLVIGFLPVLVTLIGSRAHGAVPLVKLAPSLLFCVAGAVCIGWQALSGPQRGMTGLIGLVCAIGALVSWTLYAVGNRHWLAKLTAVSVQDWNLLTGVVTGAQSLMLVPFALFFAPEVHSGTEWLRFAAVSIAVAVLASIVGNALWNRMSRLLPLTLVGQMILFETLFALIYGFVWEQRWPTVSEALAFVLICCGVISCISAHRRPS